uniref:Uncharacterized protein n=1 Tax=Coccidioides posadasii RMSCC 3488 TaxID=454284 RepID=A0A0J6FSW7_COCPO|nr:hypothetical protein CPAG_08799 [Coccidioides posadasii RMSCC 3488]
MDEIVSQGGEGKKFQDAEHSHQGKIFGGGGSFNREPAVYLVSSFPDEESDLASHGFRGVCVVHCRRSPTLGFPPSVPNRNNNKEQFDCCSSVEQDGRKRTAQLGDGGM